MKNKKYKIVFDTNFLHHDLPDRLDKVFNNNLLDINKFIKKYDIENIFLAIPDFVIEERLSQRMENIKNTILGIDNKVKSFNGFNIKLNLEKIKSKDFKKMLRTRINKFLKENKIETIKIVKIDPQILIDRSLERIKPFSDTGNKGFKDTVIWLSILEDAKKNKDKDYIFCTNDKKDFIEENCKKEFKKYSEEEFKIIENIADLKTYLDEKLVLKLELKELYEQIEEELKKKVGTITAKVVSHFLNNKTDYFSGSACEALGTYKTLSEKNSFQYFNFHDIVFLNITQENDEVYNVEMWLFLEKVKDKNDMTAGVYNVFSSLHDSTTKKINVFLKYFKESGHIEIISTREERVDYMGRDINF